ncbi:MAG TPA: class I SAM-dependent methyltransferase [Bacteroidia bacterium]|jgi:ubiquinone/menaquinone biosynthesis C-methylase UbiE|nr:class I SAM-dependent methyltransferase [Bacteroidia bacterium]
MKRQQVIDCYNKTADKYAENLFDELYKKPFDRLILKQFVKENKDKGRVLDLGCGPGQTTRFLAEQGATNIIGTDISEGMVQKAKLLNPAIEFEVADMLNLHYTDKSFGSAVAFYAIVHFTETELKQALAETFRVLNPGGQFLFSFHIGTETIHRDDFFDIPVNIDFYFFETEKILKLVQHAGFKIIDAIERYPYPDVEHPSKRAYIWVKK